MSQDETYAKARVRKLKDAMGEKHRLEVAALVEQNTALRNLLKETRLQLRIRSKHLLKVREVLVVYKARYRDLRAQILKIK